MSSNGKKTTLHLTCLPDICAAFRLLEVTKKQSNECDYPVSGSVQFQPEQISAVTDQSLEHFQPDHTNTVRVNCSCRAGLRLLDTATESGNLEGVMIWAQVREPALDLAYWTLPPRMPSL